MPVIVYLTDRVLDGTERFSLDIAEDGTLAMEYEGVPMSPESIAAGWYWKVANFRVPGAESNVSKQLSMVNELTQCNNNLWALYPDDVWLSAPRSIAQAERKLWQLIVAHDVGFTIPKTHMGNEWDDIEARFENDDVGFIVKMFRGVIADQNAIKAMYTTHVTDALLPGLREATVPFPGLYQPFLPKAREWRVTVVGDDV